ncbi:MAG: hypothetical protein AB4062_03880 [Crocosphaera sp.]
MKSRLDDIIEDLDQCIKEDIEVSSQIFGLAAKSLNKNEELLQKLEERTVRHDSKKSSNLLSSPTNAITKEELKKKYKNYKEAYKFYKNNYGITCQTGWDNLIKAIKKTSITEPKNDLQKRVTYLENKVKELEEVIKGLMIIVEK